MERGITEKIYKNQKVIERICFSFCSGYADREDLFQEIVIKVLKSYKNFKGDSSFSTWLYRVALNTAITFKSKKRDTTWFNDNVAELDSEPEDDRSEDIEILYRAIEKLRKLDRAIILLYLEEKSYEEISKITGFTVKNVSVRIVRIKRRLSELFHSLN